MGRCCDHGVSPMCPAHLAVLYPTGGGVTLHGGAWGRGGDEFLILGSNDLSHILEEGQLFVIITLIKYSCKHLINEQN